MRKKSLLVALFCGALCLTGCLKNYESESVTQVRNAKAEQLKAEAALNNAKAQAEVTMANAQAALLQAEAKIQEATAAKIAAETEYQLIENEIRELDIQLKQIAIESARIDLQIKRAELEAKQAELEVAIARAQKKLQEIAFELQQIQNAMQIDALNASKAILEAELAYLKQVEANKSAERAYIQQIANQYFALQSKNVALQIAIEENNFKISTLQAEMKDPEAVYNEEIAKNLNLINYYQACMDKIAEYATEITEEEYYELLAEAITELIDAQNVKAAVFDIYKAAIDVEAEAAADLGLHGEGGSLYRRGIAQNQINFTYEGVTEDALDFAGADADFTYVDADGNQHVLFVPEERKDYVILYRPNIDPVEMQENGLDPYYFINKAENQAFWANVAHAIDKKAVPGFFSVEWGETVIPATINVAGFQVAFDEKVAATENYVETAKEWLQRWHERDLAFQDEWINRLQARYDAEDAYVKSLESKYGEVEGDVKSTFEAYRIALDKVQRAKEALVNAQIAGAAPVQEAYAEYSDALTKLAAAQGAFAEAIQDVFKASIDLVNKKQGVINHVLTDELYVENPIGKPNYVYPSMEEVVPATTIREVYEEWVEKNGVGFNFWMKSASIALDDRYNKILELQNAYIKDWEHYMAVFEENWAYLEEDYEVAAEAFTTAMDEYKVAVAENTTLYNEYVTALVVYEGDPTDESAAALDEAYKAWKEKDDKVKGDITSNTVEPDAGEYVQAVQEARAELNKEYKFGHSLIDLYVGVYGEKGAFFPNRDILGRVITEDGDVAKFNKALEKLKADATSAAKNFEGEFKYPYSTAAVQALVDAVDEAVVAVAAVETEFQTAMTEKDDAYDAWQAAIDKITVESQEAKNLVAANEELNGYEDEEGEHVKGAFEKWQDAYDAYNKFLETYVFDGEYGTYDEPVEEGTNYLGIVWDLNEKNPHGLAAALKDAKDRKTATVNNYEQLVTALDNVVSDLEAKIEACMTYLTTMEETYKPAYIELVEAYNDAVEATITAKLALNLADYRVKLFETAYELIYSIPAETMKDANGKTIKVSEYYKAFLQNQLDIYTAAYQKALAQDNTNWNNYKAIQWLQNANANMEKQIEINEKLIEEYSKILEEWMSAE